jgi:hypothetical protein
MKTILTAAFLAATTLMAGATPMDEATRTSFISAALKSCTAELNTDAYKRALSQTEISNYCGCFSVTAASLATLEDAYSTELSTDQWTRLVIPAANYCKKYLICRTFRASKTKTGEAQTPRAPWSEHVAPGAHSDASKSRRKGIGADMTNLPGSSP